MPLSWPDCCRTLGVIAIDLTITSEDEITTEEISGSCRIQPAGICKPSLSGGSELLQKESDIRMRIWLFILFPVASFLFYSCNTTGTPPVYLLETAVKPGEGGTINPAGGDYEEGSAIELEAVPEEGYLFDRWEGDLSGTDLSDSLTFDGDKSVTAVFKRITGETGTNENGSGEEEVDNINGGDTEEEDDRGESTSGSEHDDGNETDSEEQDDPGNDDETDTEHDADETDAETVSHGFAEGVTPDNLPGSPERSYPVIRADWEGAGGNKRWLGWNLGATRAPESVFDDDPESTGWYFQFNHRPGIYPGVPVDEKVPGHNPGPASSSQYEELDSDWIDEDPCRWLLEGTWRIPTEAEWQAVADADAGSVLNLHYSGYILGNLSFLSGVGTEGYFWSSTQHIGANTAVFAGISATSGPAVYGDMIMWSGMPLRCIEE